VIQDGGDLLVSRGGVHQAEDGNQPECLQHVDGTPDGEHHSIVSRPDCRCTA
jgi:hypothetical protein